jgi:protein tyrosine/serine phosphatase
VNRLFDRTMFVAPFTGPVCLSLLRRAAAVTGAATLFVGLTTGGWAAYLATTGNIHAVVPGRLVRSAELSRSGFEHVIARYHIRTVINLRGTDSGHAWYDDELAAARTAGARHLDIRLSATHPPSSAKLNEIKAVLANAQTPILIHCQGGADRSGLVAALYEYWVLHRPVDEAGAQLSFRYGHFPWLGSRTAAMDEDWQRVVREAQ